MPIQELQEPIWEKQQGETPNQYCYFLEFLEYPTFNLKDFHQHLCENGIAGHKGAKIAAYKTLRNWAGESSNKWHSRKEAKRESEKQDLLNTLHEIDKENKIEEFQTKQRINAKILSRIEREINENALSQISHGIQGYKTLKDDNRIDMGEATDFTKSDINADIQSEIKQELSADIKIKKMQELADRMEQMDYD